MTARASAKAAGAKTYDGVPCPKGHGTLRATRNCQCVQCERDFAREAMRAKRKANPHLARFIQSTARLKQQYGLWALDYEVLLDRQGTKCPICKCDLLSRFNPGLPLATGTGRTANNVARVDHCHSTNVVQGLLCSNCNIGLGKFQDNQQILLNAVGYLRASATQQAQPVAGRESASEIEPGNRDLDSNACRGNRRDQLSPFI